MHLILFISFIISFLQVKAVIDAHPGNLSAAEAACEALTDTDVSRAPSPTRSISSVLGDKKAQEEDILQSLQRRVHQSGELLKSISQPQSQPINEYTAFANYVRDSLLTMSKRKFRKVRSAINKALTQAMEEDSENEQESQTLPSELPHMPPPVRPVKTPAYTSPSPSEMYQPPPHMWRHKPPQASVWASATKDYLEQYMQQPLQPQQQPTEQYIQQPLQNQQHPTLQHEQNMPPYQQEFQQQSSDSFSAVLGPASQVLNQNHNLSDL